MGARILRSCRAEVRIARAVAWLAEQPPGAEVQILAATREAAAELARAAVAAAGRGSGGGGGGGGAAGADGGAAAAFGWHRASLGQLAAELAQPALAAIAERGLAPIGRLAAEAVVARAIHRLAPPAAPVREGSSLGSLGALGRLGDVARTPGFARALASALEELALAGAPPLDRHSPELARIAAAYREELERAGLADRARVFALASAAAADTAARALPLLLLDLPVESPAERNLLRALAARALDVLATLPAGDPRSAAHLEQALGVAPVDLDDAIRTQTQTQTPTQTQTQTQTGTGSSLARLQAHLFEDATPPAGVLGDDVLVLSAPGEGRECVEIARILLQAAKQGMPFDRMAVLLRSPAEYRPHLEEAFARAEIPAHFAKGTVQPDPAGRAFAALLACAAEGFSARRFAEYLSLGEVPDATAEGAPPPAAPTGDRWVAPDEEMVPRAVAEALGAARAAEAPTPVDPDAAPVVDGTLRAPWRWEQLLLDAAVIGGRERWEKRLAGLEHELALAAEEADEARALHLCRERENLGHLRRYALPLLDALESLPPAPATWGDWLGQLSALATRALRHPDRVLSVLAELAPMASVGPVDLAEVQLVLSRRLLELSVPAPDRRYGKVFVAPCESARGLAFDLVCVPGLAERLFPRKIAEEPILLDDLREALGAALPTNADRIAAERRALRLAVGAASRRIVLSYPRLDLDQSRPRVPSFYALEALRAAEGALPGFDELARRAETARETRVGWPAPADPADAIDAAEHDLALLQAMLAVGEDEAVGTARYLLTANPHLGRALRFRALRWGDAWSVADGLVEGKHLHVLRGAREALRENALGARSFSPTALQNFSACPYRFFLYTVQRLAPREVPEAIDELDPLQKGSLVHEVQFELFQVLRDEGLLPVRPANLEAARERLDAALARVAARHREELAPAIERVWEAEVAAIRADLREWLRRTSEDASGFAPWRFELAFGLPGRRGRDPDSRPDPVELDCGLRLRGSIDLVERSDGGDRPRLRATDHKTGKDRVPKGGVIAGGQALQPVLYALAAEKMFPDADVESGRLYYCTSAGGFEEREVPLDAGARASAASVAELVGSAIDEPFLPAAPAHRACDFCDYRVVCGPYEELRTSRKWAGQPQIQALQRLREQK